MFKDYNTKIVKIMDIGALETNWESVLENHKAMISLIQHERIIHLLITIFVGISMLLTCLTTIITGIPILVILDLPLIALFTAYTFHYRFLENTTQNWYKITESLREKI